MNVIVPQEFKKYVCRYELAKIIKGYGIINKSLFHYFEEDDVVNGEHISCGRLMNPTPQHISAYNVTELTYMIGHKFQKPDLIPIQHFSKHDKEGTFALYTLQKSRYFEVQADAHATFLIEMIEAGELTVDHINNRMKKYL